eukprot:364817-Amphidinium_carterae.1
MCGGGGSMQCVARGRNKAGISTVGATCKVVSNRTVPNTKRLRKIDFLRLIVRAGVTWTSMRYGACASRQSNFACCPPAMTSSSQGNLLMRFQLVRDLSCSSPIHATRKMQ